MEDPSNAENNGVISVSMNENKNEELATFDMNNMGGNMPSKAANDKAAAFKRKMEAREKKRLELKAARKKKKEEGGSNKENDSKKKSSKPKPAPKVQNIDDIPIGGQNSGPSITPKVEDIPINPPKQDNAMEQPLAASKNIDNLPTENNPEEGAEPVEEEERIPPKVGYTIDFDNLDSLNPFGGGGGINPFGGTSKMGFDNPVAETPSELPPPEPEDEESLKKGPIIDRVLSKNFKKRKFAFIELQELAENDKSNPIFSELEEKFPVMMSERNPEALEHVLMFFNAYMENSGKGVLVKAVGTKLIEYGMTQTKRETVLQLSKDFFRHLYNKNKESMTSLINSQLPSKKYKNALATYDGLMYLMDTLGPKQMDLFKPFLEAAVKSTVIAKTKPAAMAFFKNCISWIGKTYLGLITDLKAQLMTKLTKFAEENPIPTKSLKKAKKAKKVKKNVEVEEESESESEEAMDFANMDPYEMADEVDAFKQYNDAWTQKVLKSKKWNERKKMIEEFVSFAEKNPKFANTKHHHMLAMCKKIFMESNQMVNIATLKLLGAMAKCLRGNFKDEAKTWAGIVIQKFKEKNVVIAQCHLTLKDMEYCIGPEDVMDDIKEVIDPKNKKVTVVTNTIQWVIEYLKKNPEKMKMIGSKMVKKLCKQVNNGDTKIRDSTFQMLGLMKAYTDNHWSKEMSDIDPKKMKKINKYCDSFNDEKNKGAPDASPEPKADKKKSRGRSRAGDDEDTPKKPPKRPSRRPRREIEEDEDQADEDSPAQQRSRAPPKSRPKRSKKIDKKLFSDDEDEEEEQKSKRKIRGGGKDSGNELKASERLEDPRINIDEVNDTLFDIEFPDDITDQLSQIGWKEKLNGVKELYAWMIDNMNYCKEAVYLIYWHTKKFTESNPKVNKAIYKMFKKLSEDIVDKKEILCESNVSLIVRLCVERFNDKNCTEKSIHLLTRCCSVVKPQAMIASMIDYISTKSVNPKMCNEMEEFFNKMMPVITQNHLPFLELLNFAKDLLNSKQATSRKVGMAIICNFYSMMGDKIRDYLDDVHHNVMKTLEAEFKKKSVNLVQQPTIEIKGNKRHPAPSQNRSTQQAEALNDFISKIDLKRELNTLLKSLKNPNWENRKEAIQTAIKTFQDANYKCKISGLDSITYELSEKIDDTHKAVLLLSLKFVGEFARCLGPNFKQYSMAYLPILLKHIPGKSQVREAALSSIDVICENVDNVLIMNNMLNSTNEESPDGRIIIMKFILDRAEYLPDCDFKQASKYLVASLSHQKKEVRDIAKELIGHIIPHVGDKSFRSACDKLKGNFKKASHKILDEIQGVEDDADDEQRNSKPESRVDVGAGNISSRGARNDRSKSRIRQKSISRRNSIQKSNYSRNENSGYGQESDLNDTAHGDPQRAMSYKNSIPAAQIYEPSNKDPSKLIYMSNDRKVRLSGDKWDYSGPNDRQIEIYYQRIKQHFNPDLVKMMFSVDVNKFYQSTSQILNILETEPQTFMNVQDLVLQWIFFRSFEARPSVVTYFIDFLTKILEKYSGASFFLPVETEYLICSCIWLFIGFRMYVDDELYTQLIKLMVRQTGEAKFIHIIMSLTKNNDVVQKYHFGDLLDIILVLMSETGGHSLLKAEYIQILEELCYSQVNENKLKNLTVIKNLYMINPQIVKPNIQSRDLHLVQAIETLIMQQGGGMMTDRSVNPNQEALSNDPQNVPTINHQIVESELAENQDQTFGLDGQDDQSFVDGEALSEDNEYSELSDLDDQVTDPEILKQVDAYINNLLNQEDEYALEYLQYMNSWVTDPSMVEYIAARANHIIIKTIKHLQEVSMEGMNLMKKEHYNFAFGIVSKFAFNTDFMLELNENSVFDLIDTLLLLLLGSNDLILNLEPSDPDNEYLKSLKDTMNNSILSIISNGDTNTLVVVFFDLLVKSETEFVPDKFKGLTVKCLMRVYKKLSDSIDELDLPNIFLKMHQYLIEVEDNNMIQDIGFKAVKTFLKRIVELKDSSEVLEIFDAMSMEYDLHESLRVSLEKYIIQVNQSKADVEKQVLAAQTRANGLGPNTLSQADSNSTFRGSVASKPVSKQSNPPARSQSNVHQYGNNQTQMQTQPPGGNNNQELPQEIAETIQAISVSGLKKLGLLVNTLHAQLLNYPQIEIKNYINMLKPSKLKYVLRELDRREQKHETSFQQNSASKSEYMSIESGTRRSIQQGRNSTKPQTQEMMKKLQGMKELMRQKMQNQDQ